jgi:carbon monoxide dehydrogenase subunit G
VIVRRSRIVTAAPEAVRAVIADPATLPRWWPGVERVEGVSGDGWTTVLRSGRGRVVRADWVREGEAWVQQVDGTPFARVLAERRVEARVDDSSRVTLELRQRGRGWARLGGFLLRGAARRELDGALEGLEAATAR